MIKTLKNLLKQDKERYTVPRKVQDVIPVRRIWKDGIFQVGGRFSKTYQFTDINYLVASREDKEQMFLAYSELLNSLDSGATTKITINNRRLNRANFEQSILMPMRGDACDVYRREYNQMLLDKATGANGIIQEKYITVSVCKKDIEEARTYFARIGADLIAHFAALGSKCTELDAAEKLRVLHDFYRQGEEAAFHFDPQDMMRKGHNFKDYICPDSMEKSSDCLKLGEKYCRVLFLKDYASYIKDSMVTELTDFNRNMMCNKANLLNQSAFLLGVPGSGKSFSAKELIAFLILNTTDDVLICDPENEFGALAAALGKETTTVIHMAAGGKDRLNAMYMVDGYGENNPIVEKSQFIMSLVEQIDKAGVGPQQKSIIDRCTALVYQDAERTGKPATLCDLRNKLLEQPEEKAKEIALSLELFTTGSLDIFGHESTVDLDKRIVVFDIHGLGEQLKPTGLLVITDTILNRVTLNWKKGKRTHIFIDEFHVVFENEQSGIFFNSAWRQFRKRNGYPTAITQNVEYLLDSVQASTMLSNSEFVVMLNQAFSDRAKLSKLLNISDEQMSYVTNADAGCGLIKYGSALVPFINRFPKDTELYRLMTTRPGEGVFGSGNAS